MYNSLSALPKAPYEILRYLALNNENIWKMLKYNSYDALSKPDLTFVEKMNLVWKEGAQEKYSVFFTNLVEDVICESKCILKIYDSYVHANPNIYNSIVIFSFDFLYGGQMSLVEKEGIPVNRGDLFINELLTTLNGVPIGGVGKLMFSDDMSRYDSAQAVVGNSKTFTGVVIKLSTLMGDSGKEDSCGA